LWKESVRCPRVYLGESAFLDEEGGPTARLVEGVRKTPSVSHTLASSLKEGASLSLTFYKEGFVVKILITFFFLH